MSTSEEAQPAVPQCPDCRVEMEIGWQLDSAPYVLAQAQWFAGVRKENFFGVHGAGRPVPITSYRCPQCSLIRQFAFRKTYRKIS